jgi:hypothetical protein
MEFRMCKISFIQYIAEYPDITKKGYIVLFSLDLCYFLDFLGLFRLDENTGPVETAFLPGFLGSSFKCNTHGPQGIGCCDGQSIQAPWQRGTWRDFGRASAGQQPS